MRRKRAALTKIANVRKRKTRSVTKNDKPPEPIIIVISSEDEEDEIEEIENEDKNDEDKSEEDKNEEDKNEEDKNEEDKNEEDKNEEDKNEEDENEEDKNEEDKNEDKNEEDKNEEEVIEEDAIEEIVETPVPEDASLAYKVRFNKDLCYGIHLESRVSSSKRIFNRFERILNEFNELSKDRLYLRSKNSPYDSNKYPAKKFGFVVGSYMQFLAYNGFSTFEVSAGLLKDFLEDHILGRNSLPIRTALSDYVTILALAYNTVFHSKIKSLNGRDYVNYVKAHDDGKMNFLNDVGGFATNLEEVWTRSNNMDDSFVTGQADLLSKHTEQIIAHHYNLANPLRETQLNCAMDLLLSVRSSLRGESKRALNLMDISYTEKYDSSRGSLPLLSLTIRKDHSLSSDELPRITTVTRNKNPLVCLVTAIAFSLWYDFDMPGGRFSGAKRPNFFNPKQFNNIKLLYNANDNQKSPIDSIINNVIASQNLHVADFEQIHHTTHGETSFNVNADRISLEHIKMNNAQGASSLHDGEIYGSSLPFIMKSAGFEANESYHVPRDIKPADWISRQIFPWLDGTIKSHKQWQERTGIYTEYSKSVDNFFQMLLSFRSVILQDLAAMNDSVPRNIFADHSITRSPIFFSFKRTVKMALESTEKQSTLEPQAPEKEAAENEAAKKAASKKKDAKKKAAPKKAAPEANSNGGGPHLAKEIVFIGSDTRKASGSFQRRMDRAIEMANQELTGNTKEPSFQRLMGRAIEIANQEVTGNTKESLFQHSMDRTVEKANQEVTGNTKEARSKSNDSISLIREQISDILDIKFDKMDNKVGRIEDKIGTMESKINRMDNVDRMGAKIDQTQNIDRIDRMEVKIDKMESKLDAILGALRPTKDK